MFWCFPHLFKEGDIYTPWVTTRNWYLLEMFEVQVLFLQLRSAIFLQHWQLCNLQRISCNSRKTSAVPHVFALPPHCLQFANVAVAWIAGRLPDAHIRANTFTSQEIWSAKVWMMLIGFSLAKEQRNMTRGRAERSDPMGLWTQPPHTGIFRPGECVWY